MAPNGLVNSGNSCFLNAVLQLLAADKSFVGILAKLDRKVRLPIRKLPAQEARRTDLKRAIFYELLDVLKKLVCEKTELNGEAPITPKVLLSRLVRMLPEWKPHRQQDAHECFLQLLNVVHEMLMAPVKSMKSGETYGESLVNDLFGGKYRNATTCQECFLTVETRELFLDISLPLPRRTSVIMGEKKRKNVGSSWWDWLGFNSANDDGISLPNVGVEYGRKCTEATFKCDNYDISLNSCFGLMFAQEILPSSLMYFCENCKKSVSVARQHNVEELPELLLLHMKRFEYKPGRQHSKKLAVGNNNKLTARIEFPLDGLQVPGDPSGSKYCLVGVIEHRGHSWQSGHYVAFVRGGGDRNVWYLCNDRKIEVVSEATVLNAEAYILMYRKANPTTGTMDVDTDIIELREQFQFLEGKRFAKGEKQVYLSKYWLQKFLFSSFPGPLNNARHLCRHLNVYASDHKWFTPICASLYAKLAHRFGELGDAVLSLDDCKGCASEKKSWRCQRKDDKTFFETVLQSSVKDDHVKPGQPWYLIHAQWLQHWRAFLINDTDGASHSRRVRMQWGFYDSDEIAPPGPIANSCLLMDEGGAKSGLRVGHDYRGVSQVVWDHLVTRYGGGPAIPRVLNDIYSAPYVLPNP